MSVPGSCSTMPGTCSPARPTLAGPARELLTAGGDAGELEAATADGVVCAVRTPAHAAVAVCGRFAIGGVVRQDLRTALAALEGRAAGPGATAPAPPGDRPTRPRKQRSQAPRTA